MTRRRLDAISFFSTMFFAGLLMVLGLNGWIFFVLFPAFFFVVELNAWAAVRSENYQRRTASAARRSRLFDQEA